ncbi:MAG: hypothetical protein IJB82_03140 [Bacilli bacterium]|nr:hypothetical protein [Bacilli bacterium]
MNIENKKNISKVIKREIILTIISVVVLVSFFSLFTYAFFMDIKETDVNVLNYGDLTLEFCVDASCDSNIENIGRTIGTDENGDPVSMYPQSELEALENVPYIFKVTNTGDYKQTIKIKLMKKENPELHGNYSDYRELDLQYLNLSFSELGLEVQTMPYQEFDGILDTIVLEPNEERIYNLWLWIKEDAPNSIQGSYFIADISLTGEYEVERGTLTQTILADNIPQSDAGISFGSTSASDGTNGLYYTSDTTKTENGEVVYYYRGAVANNYVVFGNYCWRIVRTVEDGSVRLRYGGSPTQNGETYTCPQTGTAVNIGTDQVYNEDFDDKSYVNYKTSNIRTVIENWYRDNIAPHTSLTNLIADTPYCNDMSEPTTTNRFGAYDRLYTNKSPQYKCPSSTYGYTVAKGDLTYPITLLTADEVAYAGGVYGQSNSSYYLYTNEYYWTMSPYYFRFSSATVFGVLSDGHLSDYDVSGASAVVPVVSLKAEATVKRGTGLYNDPYVINTD